MAFPVLQAYEWLIYSLPAQYPEIEFSTLRLFSNSPTTCFLRGSIRFRSGLELRAFEYLDFLDGEILDYFYVVLHGQERIRWYDPQPHPDIPDLASTLPHHLHEMPDIKHNRRTAPGISFTSPNLPVLIAECIALGSLLRPPVDSPESQC